MQTERLNYFKYLEDPDLPEDNEWVVSFNKFIHALELGGGDVPLSIITDSFSVDYSQCWSGPHASGQTYWIPGTKNRPLTGKRPLTTIAMFLCDPEKHLRGSKIVHVCPDPYCCNPAHLYVVSNKCKILDKTNIGIADEEWEAIRRCICMLERHRQEEQDVYQVAMANFNGTPKERRLLEESLDNVQSFRNMTNDEILMNAIQVGAKNISNSIQYGSFSAFLAEYQLITPCNTLRAADRGILQEMTSLKDANLGNRELYIDALNYIAKHSPSGTAVREALQAINMWRC